MTKTIGITGASSVIAQHLKKSLLAQGFEVYLLGRSGENYFNLDPFTITITNPLDLMIHLAWDLSTNLYYETNFTGSIKLFDWCLENKIDFIFVSSMSSFENAQSLYGRTKYAVEIEVLRRNGIVVRPGLIYSLDEPFGITGSIQKAISHLPILPIVGYNALQYPVELGTLIQEIATMVNNPNSFKGKLTNIRPNRPIKFGVFLRSLFPKKLPVLIPWRMVYYGLKFVEFIGIKSRLRSDSLVGLINYNPNPPDSIQSRKRH